MKINKIAAITFLSISVLALPRANAKQTKKIINGREVVVHTNPIPVVLHRLVPPQHGRHVTQKEVAQGKIPNPTQRPSTPKNVLKRAK